MKRNNKKKNKTTHFEFFILAIFLNRTLLTLHHKTDPRLFRHVFTVKYVISILSQWIYISHNHEQIIFAFLLVFAVFLRLKRAV